MPLAKAIRSRLKRLFQPSPQTPPASPELADRSQETPPVDFEVYTIPVLVVSYFPVKKGRIDPRVTGDVGAPLNEIRRHTRQTTQQVIQALETGSTYHGYKDPQAQPNLRYRIVETLEFLDPLPTHRKHGHSKPMTDYHAILQRCDIRHWVEERGTREVWLWGYHGGVLDLWESNMAGPHGDISNSDRDPHDLPVLSKTYTLYHYNYQRGASEAVEDHMHQIEAVLGFVDPHLFWDKFVGKPGEGRCGWSHYPPNAQRDYDWTNRNYVWTDIEDWTPEGSGQKQRMNCTRWNCDSLTWFIYWMQNLPGASNGLSYQGHRLTNWWGFIGDFDEAVGTRKGLY
jgi:hypothetical protein